MQKFFYLSVTYRCIHKDQNIIFKSYMPAPQVHSFFLHQLFQEHMYKLKDVITIKGKNQEDFIDIS